SNLGWPFASNTDYKDPGIYGFNLTYNPSFTAKQVLEQFDQELQALQTTPVPAAELDRARAALRSQRIRGLQSTMTRAQLLAQYELLDGNPELLNNEMAEYLAVTPA